MFIALFQDSCVLATFEEMVDALQDSVNEWIEKSDIVVEDVKTNVAMSNDVDAHRGAGLSTVPKIAERRKIPAGGRGGQRRRGPPAVGSRAESRRSHDIGPRSRSCV